MPNVFLSPSTQHFNLYVNGGDERQYMNYIADRMEAYLRSSGILFSRNDPNLDFRAAIEASNAGNYDVHFAIHSNAAGPGNEGKIRGSEYYYDPDCPESERLAQITANHMKRIYPDPAKVRIIPTTELSEVIRTKAVAILCEVAYHDNLEDAEWIKANLTPIAIALVKSLCEYLGIAFKEPVKVTYGIVVTSCACLNVRQRPSACSCIVGTIPNGKKVRICGRCGEWYSVEYNNVSGFVPVNCVAV